MSQTTSGKIFAPHFARIPDALKVRRQWVVWKAVWQPAKEKYSKVPYNARTGGNASSTDPLTWSEFDEAVVAYQTNPRTQGHADAEKQWAGIGFVLAPADQYAGIDLDHAIVDRADQPGKGVTKELTPDALRWVARLDSYTEVSPSGTGLRVFVKATLPPGGRKKGDVEMYETARFLTVTGRHWPTSPRAIIARQDAVDAMHREIWPAPTEAEKAERAAKRVVNLDMSDGELLEKAFASKTGNVLRALYFGDRSAYAGDHSAADLGLCSRLAFWSGGDAARLDSWFRASRLMRDKWDAPHFASGETYGQRTVRFALDGAGAFYAPKGSPKARAKALSRTVAELAALPPPTRRLPLAPSRNREVPRRNA